MGVEHDTDLVALQNFVQQHPSLPKNIEPLLLRRYLQAVRNDAERAKKLLELSFNMRNQYPEIFLNREPLDNNTKLTLEITDMLPLPYPTKENYKVLLYRLRDFNADKFNFTEAIKVFFMVADVRLATKDMNGMSDGEIPIFDMAGFSLRHLTKLVMSSLRVYMRYTQEAHPVRLKQIHVINCSSFLDRIMMMLKPFIKSEVFKLIHFHLPGSTTLDEFVPTELLPKQYGGKAGDINDIKQNVVDSLYRHRDYLMDESRWKTIKGQKDSFKMEPEIVGNFKTLSID